MADPIDRTALARFLAGLGLEGPVELTRITGGRSNLTYRLTVGADEYVLRLPPSGVTLKGAHDVVREYRIMEHLQDSGVPTPRTIALCEDVAVLGVPFFLTAFVRGHTLRSWDDLGRLAAGATSVLTPSFAGALARLHAAPMEGLGRPDAADDYLLRQLHVWTRQVRATGGHWAGMAEALADRLRAAAPAQRARGIVHGDFRLDNVLVAGTGEVLAVVDWELWTLGDPAADLAASLTYWSDSPWELLPLADSVTALGALGTRSALLDAYAAAGGEVPDDRDLPWYLAYGAWRYAAILDGIHHRNRTTLYGPEHADPGWERYAYVVPVLLEMAGQHLADHRRGAPGRERAR